MVRLCSRGGLTAAASELCHLVFNAQHHSATLNGYFDFALKDFVDDAGRASTRGKRLGLELATADARIFMNKVAATTRPIRYTN